MSVTVIGNKLQVEVLADESTKKQLNDIQQEVKDLEERLEERVDTIIAGTVEGVSGAEIVDARQGKVTLGANITEIKSELAQKAKQADLVVERERINLITSLPEGSTTNDARLEDIKIGADGVTYDSPATAVRTQISKISSDVEGLINRELSLDIDIELNDVKNEVIELESGYYQIVKNIETEYDLSINAYGIRDDVLAPDYITIQFYWSDIDGSVIDVAGAYHFNNYPNNRVIGGTNFQNHNEKGFYHNSSYLGIKAPKSEIQGELNLQNALQWVKNQNITLDYILANPTSEIVKLSYNTRQILKMLNGNNSGELDSFLTIDNGEWRI